MDAELAGSRSDYFKAMSIHDAILYLFSNEKVTQYMLLQKEIQ
jgi:hypothetical protein